MPPLPPIRTDRAWIREVLRGAGVVVEEQAPVVVTDGAGARPGVLALVRDVREAERAIDQGAEDALVWPDEVSRLPRALRVCAARAGSRRDFERLRDAFRASPAWMELADDDIRLIDVSAGFEHQSGYPRSSAIGRTPGEIFRRGTHPVNFYDEITRTLEQRGEWEGDLLGTRRDGSVAVVDTLVQVLSSAQLATKRGGGRSPGATASWISRSTAEPWLLVEGDGTIVDACDQIHGFLGRERQTLLGAAVHELGLDLPDLSVEQTTVVDRVWLERVVALDIASRRVGGALLHHIVFVDVTERTERAWALDALAGELREAVAEAEAADRTKGAFLATMSHELRTPLNAVLGYAELLEEEGVEGVDELRRVRDAGHRLLGLIDEVLDLARVEAGEMLCDPRPTDAEAIVREVFDANRLRAAATRKRLTYRDGRQIVVADPLRLHQILANLVTNALKYAVPGEVQVTVRDGLVAVDDEGPGIPEAEAMRVFIAFHRLQRDGDGIGLGLALCQRLCHAMGTDLRYDRSALGGSRFWFRLPVAQGGPGEGGADA